MKFNFWTVLGIALIVVTVVVWIIPAILMWQKKNHDHDEKMMDKSIELKMIENNPAETMIKRSFKDKVIDFFGKAIAEAGPTIAGKMISGI